MLEGNLCFDTKHKASQVQQRLDKGVTKTYWICDVCIEWEVKTYSLNIYRNTQFIEAEAHYRADRRQTEAARSDWWIQWYSRHSWGRATIRLSIVTSMYFDIYKMYLKNMFKKIFIFKNIFAFSKLFKNPIKTKRFWMLDYIYTSVLFNNKMIIILKLWQVCLTLGWSSVVFALCLHLPLPPPNSPDNCLTIS